VIVEAFFVTMPRDYHRLAAPAVFCSSVSRSFRPRSPPRRRRSPIRNVPSRQRERLVEDHECEYDDYAAEIASYNRLRRGDRNAVSSASNTTRHTHESYYDDLTTAVAPQSNTYYYVSHFDTDNRLHVGVPSHRSSAAYASDDSNLHAASRLGFDDRQHQHRKHKKKRRHHHCHSRSSAGKHSENGSSDRPPRDTVAALKALANYGGIDNHSASSMRSTHHCDSPRNFQQKESCKGNSPADDGSTADEMRKVSVNASSLPLVDSSKDNLSPGECTDDDDGVGVSVDKQITQKAVAPSSSPPHVTNSEHSYRSSLDVSSNCITTVVSSVDSTKTVYSDTTAHLTDESPTHIHQTNDSSCVTSATSSAESKAADGERLLMKDDVNAADHSEGQSAVQLKVAPSNKETSAVDVGSNKASEEKRHKLHKSQSLRARRNYRKKSADDERQTDADDVLLPRFVVHFAAVTIKVVLLLQHILCLI